MATFKYFMEPIDNEIQRMEILSTVKEEDQKVYFVRRKNKSDKFCYGVAFECNLVTDEEYNRIQDFYKRKNELSKLVEGLEKERVEIAHLLT